jgi:hypothetical protein
MMMASIMTGRLRLTSVAMLSQMILCIWKSSAITDTGEGATGKFCPSGKLMAWPPTLEVPYSQGVQTIPGKLFEDKSSSTLE